MAAGLGTAAAGVVASSFATALSVVLDSVTLESAMVSSLACEMGRGSTFPSSEHTSPV